MLKIEGDRIIDGLDVTGKCNCLVLEYVLLVNTFETEPNVYVLFMVL